MPRYEYIYEIVKDADGVDCFVKHGEVIRCRDCKWYDATHPYGTVIPGAYHCKVNDRFYEGYHFCAYGERRTDADNSQI